MTAIDARTRLYHYIVSLRRRAPAVGYWSIVGVDALATHLRSDSEFASLPLCSFLGDPAVGLIEDVLGIAFPVQFGLYAPEASVIGDAIKLVCSERAASRRAELVVVGLLGVAAGVALIGLAQTRA